MTKQKQFLQGHKEKHNRKDFKPNPISAIVIRKWNNKKYSSKGQPVFLTNMGASNPFIAFDRYDERSLIENCLFRESKQKWNLNYPPKKTEKGVKIHIFLTMMAIATTTAYRLWEVKQESAIEMGRTPGIEIYRRQMVKKTRDKVIVFKDDKYGILYTQEMAILLGAKIKEPSKEVGKTKEEILEKYKEINKRKIRAP